MWDSTVLHLAANAGLEDRYSLQVSGFLKLLMARYTDLPDNKNKPFGGAYSVYDEKYCYHARLFSSESMQKDTSSHDFEQYLNMTILMAV